MGAWVARAAAWGEWGVGSGKEQQVTPGGSGDVRGRSSSISSVLLRDREHFLVLPGPVSLSVESSGEGYGH